MEDKGISAIDLVLPLYSDGDESWYQYSFKKEDYDRIETEDSETLLFIKIFVKDKEIE